MTGYAELCQDLPVKDLIATYRRMVDQIKPGMEYRDSQRLKSKIEMVEKELDRRDILPSEYQEVEPDITW